jgi:RNA-binding protein|tara:strand:+ start:2745 stop:3128 length:384 start_codon:yes stop_codon:yes gene_type:complete
MLTYNARPFFKSPGFFMSNRKQPLSNQELKKLRAIAHGLKPVVTIAQNGLSEGVLKEINRALAQHELIKIKVSVGDRDARQEVTEEVCQQTGAQCVQSIGNVVVLLKPAAKPDPKLSNLLRFGGTPQ